MCVCVHVRAICDDRPGAWHHLRDVEREQVHRSILNREELCNIVRADKDLGVVLLDHLNPLLPDVRSSQREEGQRHYTVATHDAWEVRPS